MIMKTLVDERDACKEEGIILSFSKVFGLNGYIPDYEKPISDIKKACSNRSFTTLENLIFVTMMFIFDERMSSDCLITRLQNIGSALR